MHQFYNLQRYLTQNLLKRHRETGAEHTATCSHFSRSFLHNNDSILKMFLDLQQGDDVAYLPTPSSSVCYGRIVTVSTSSYIVLRYTLYQVDDDPPTTYTLSEMKELYLTSFRVEITKAVVEGVIFVFSVSEISDLIYSPVGISNIFFIRYKEIDDQFIELEDWISFRRGFLLSYPRQIFTSMLIVQESIFKILNNRSIGQGSRGTLRIHLPLECWLYIKLKGFNNHISFYQKRGTRVDRTSTHDLVKGSRRRNVNIEIIEAVTDEGVKTFKALFGSIILYGARTKPASLGNEAVGVLRDTIINIPNRIRFTYII